MTQPGASKWPQNSDTLQVGVVGLGYIGLPTAAVIAQTGAQVLGIDVNAHIVETVGRGDIHIEEANLDALVRDVVASGLLRTAIAPQPADVFVIAVPTPFMDDHVPDLRFVRAAARAVAGVLRPGNLVILESTAPVGTTEAMRDEMAASRPDLNWPGRCAGKPDIAVAYCPERVLPGKILQELISNDRCIGGISEPCAEAAKAFYERFVEGECVITDARTAEMCKLVENSFRDVNIAFANELSMVADTLGIDVWKVISLANRHPRVNILQPGPGVGGHCIAVDPWFIVDSDPANARLIRTAREVNDGKIGYSIARAEAAIAAAPGGSIACLGLAFKANIDDLRESPAIKVASAIAERYGDRVMIVEPHIDALPIAFRETGAVLVSLDEALDRCEALIVLVDHDEFKAVPVERRADKKVYDTRGIWVS
ncbi:MAG: UDP-N-acetyl-D-mannosamine dehydrogenase [Sphingomonas sp.]